MKYVKYSCDVHWLLYIVDARSSSSVNRVAHHVQQTTKTILGRVPKNYGVCDDLRVLLFNWKSEHSNKPIMRWEDFVQLCETKIPALRIQSLYDDPTKVEER